MPTPYQHLVSAIAILEAPELPGVIKSHLTAEKGAFLLGNIAGDVRYLTRQPRSETHFHEVPPSSSNAPIEKMFQSYPALADPDRLTPAQAAFVSGYLLHLIWDANWVLEVFCPYYLDADGWSQWKDAMIHHNALRLVLDRRALAKLPVHDTAVALRHACPKQWVPFIADAVLREWRDRIARHLTAPKRVEGAATVFAERMNISIDYLLNVAHAIELEADDVHLSGLAEAVERFQRNAHEESIALLQQYWHAREAPREGHLHSTWE
jgi:hypothetical protein